MVLIKKTSEGKNSCDLCDNFCVVCRYTGTRPQRWDRCDLFKPIRRCKTCGETEYRVMTVGGNETELRFCKVYNRCTIDCESKCTRWMPNGTIKAIMDGMLDVLRCNDEKGEESIE